MEKKTKVIAVDSPHDLLKTREFELPLELLFKAYVDAGIVEQWMGTKMLKLENRKHGAWQFETADGNGNVVFRANGVIHEFITNRQFIRTFEMENTFPVQLEFLTFEALTTETSKLSIHIIFKSVEDRNLLLKLPFAQGINMAHNRLQDRA